MLRAGVCLVVVAQIGEPFKDAEQILVPAASADLDVASVTLRTERPKPRDLVSAFDSWRHSEASEDAHQVKRLAHVARHYASGQSFDERAARQGQD
jgi:hypothetical protein